MRLSLKNDDLFSTLWDVGFRRIFPVDEWKYGRVPVNGMSLKAWHHKVVVTDDHEYGYEHDAAIILQEFGDDTCDLYITGFRKSHIRLCERMRISSYDLRKHAENLINEVNIYLRKRSNSLPDESETTQKKGEEKDLSAEDTILNILEDDDESS